jgi:Protein of unknown function (DUF2934)
MLNQTKPPEIQYSAASDRQDAIRRRAEEIYVRNGRKPGRDLDNWAQAEREIQQELLPSQAVRLPAIVVKVNGVQYIGEYSPEASDSYVPGEFDPGAPIPVRFEGDKMFVKRPNGKELETRIVKKIG